MHVKRRRLPNFETCSVALFASLALCGPLPSRAQTTTPSTRSVTSTPSTAPALPRSGTGTAPPGPAPVGTAIPPNNWTAEQLRGEFKKGDANGDGRLSRDEAAIWSGLARRFDQVDSNKDGSISSAEFDEALK